jgi:hypothetical protein
VKKKNKITFLILILAEFIFFYRNELQMSEMFFFVWFLIFATFFGFRFIDGGTGLGGLGAGSKYFAAKVSESMVEDKYSKYRNNDLSFDLIFALLAVLNLILSLASYYIAR